MNFRPLPKPVQDEFDATIADLLEDSTIFAHADRNFIEKLEAAMALCSPHFEFAGLHGDELVQMQRPFALKQVLGTLLLSSNGADMERLYDLLVEYLQVSPWARRGLISLYRAVMALGRLVLLPAYGDLGDLLFFHALRPVTNCC